MASFLLIGAIAMVTLVYYLMNSYSKRFSYFKEQGIPYFRPEFIHGNTRNLSERKMCNGEFYRDIYGKYRKRGAKHGGGGWKSNTVAEGYVENSITNKHKIATSILGENSVVASAENIQIDPTRKTAFSTGIFEFTSRVWVPVDPELVKTVLVKDFEHFSAHNIKYPGLFFNNLFHMDGEEWKDMRKKLTPTFTSGKMKMMYDILLQKSYGLVRLVGEMSKTGEPAEIKALLARFTTDVIGNCAFGIECNSVEDVDSEFFKQGQNVFKHPASSSTVDVVLMALGLKKRKIPNFKPIEDFFRGVVRETLKYREDNKLKRKDFLHLMIQLKNKGFITELINEDEDVFEKTVTNEVMSLEDIAGECILFFTAGFETSSTTMSYVLLELTQNQDVQKKLREEIRHVLKKHNGKLTYEALLEMTYLDNVINETLRKYPPVATIPRLCTKNYTIPGTNSVIEKGTKVQISAWGLQMDPEYFPDPEKFDPDRFNAENKSKIHPFTFLPFGEGPRKCLGLRFGVMQSKTGLATLINSYNFTLNKKTPYPPMFNKRSFIITVDGGIWLNATKVE